MFTKIFWKGAGERALKSAAQFGLFGWGTATFTNVGEVVSAAQATGLAILFGAVISVLTSVATAKVGDEDTPSMVKGQL